MASTSPARGMRDFLPIDVRRREYVIGVIRGVYERYGFQPLETPAVENIETLLGKYGEEGNQLIFKILKRGEHEASGQADLALRYDLTVPLVAGHRRAPARAAEVLQALPDSAGVARRSARPRSVSRVLPVRCRRHRLDVAGRRGRGVRRRVRGDAVRSGFADFVLRLNHRAVLAGVLDTAGIPPERHGDALVALDKLDKIGLDGVRAEYAQRGLAPEAADAVLSVLASVGAGGATMPARRAGDRTAASSS